MEAHVAKPLKRKPYEEKLRDLHAELVKAAGLVPQ